MAAIEELDVCGLSCPMPLIRIGSTVSKLPKGQSLSIIGDDPIFEDSVRDYCAEHKLTIDSVEKNGNKIKFTVRL